MKQHFLPISILIAGVLVSGAILYNGNTPSEGANTADTAVKSGKVAGEKEIVPNVTEADYARGANAEDAAVTVIEYLDYRCGFCGKFHSTMERIIEETDDVRWVVRDLAIFGTDPAVAAECVGRFGGEEAFWDFGNKLFENQNKIGREYFEELATGYGISEEDFTQCFTSDEVLEQVTNQSRDARDAGARGTPFSVIMDEETGKMYPFAGALPYDQVMQKINEAREK